MSEQKPEQNPGPPSLWQTAGSVLAAFFGVQSSEARRRDFSRGKASHFIVMGLVMTVGFILVVVMAVRFALSQAG